MFLVIKVFEKVKLYIKNINVEVESTLGKTAQCCGSGAKHA